MKNVRTHVKINNDAFVGEHNSHKGTKWWNDGQINKRSVECPGKEFIPGRIPLGPYNRG